MAISPALVNNSRAERAVAQLGSALEWGSRGRGFKSRRPDSRNVGERYADVPCLCFAKQQNRSPLYWIVENLEDRLRRHNSGDSKATRHGLPWALVHSESFSNRAEAVRKERYYKTGRGRDELDRLSS